MIFIHHRINTLQQLENVPVNAGIELDVRYHENELILHHDPFAHHINQAETLENLLKHWKHDGPLIINLKTEGVEERCIALMNQYAVKSWFFLDMSMPYFVKYANQAAAKTIPGFGAENLAVRYSEYEAIEYSLGFSGKVKWVWADCFNKLPLDDSIIKQFHKAGFKICVVSPELQGHDISRIAEFKNLLKNNASAVCTKHPELWI